jgi:hypothetical protein
MEKYGPYCFIGVGPHNFKLPLSIEWMPKTGLPRLIRVIDSNFGKKVPKRKRKIREWDPLMNSASIQDEDNI